MSGIDLPIYLIAIGDGWLGLEVGPDLNASFAFGSEEEADRYLQHTADVNKKPRSLYRIVEVRSTGRVIEG